MDDGTNVRRSTRATGLALSNDELKNNGNIAMKLKSPTYRDTVYQIQVDPDSSNRNSITFDCLRSFIENENKEHSLLLKDSDLKHCLYRVSYMSNDALGSRIRGIAR